MIVQMALVDLPRDPSAPSEARAQVQRFPCDLGPVQRTDAIQAANELVTNAYLHGEGRIRLRLESDGRGLRVEVESGNGNGTAPRDGDEKRRFDVVRALSESCGTEAADATNWFEIGTNGAAPAG